MTDPELVEAIAEALWAVRTGHPIGQSAWPNVSDDALTVTRRDAATALAVVQVRSGQQAAIRRAVDDARAPFLALADEFAEAPRGEVMPVSYAADEIRRVATEATR